MRRALLAAVVCVVLAGAAAAYGRVEGEHAVDVQQHGILAVRAAVGTRFPHPRQEVWDPGGRLDCLMYDVKGNIFALELCFDPAGRLVEAVDRRHGERIWSVRWDPSAGPLRYSARRLETAVRNTPADGHFVGLEP